MSQVRVWSGPTTHWRVMSGGVPSLRAPGPARQVAVAESSGQLTVTWLPPYDNGGTPLLGYTITIEPDDAPGQSLDSTDLTWTFVGLENGVAYTVSLTALNEAGFGEEAEVLATPSGEWVIGSIGPIVGAPAGWGGSTLTPNGRGYWGATTPPPGVTNGYQLGATYCGVLPVLTAQGKTYDDLHVLDASSVGTFIDAKGLPSGTVTHDPVTGNTFLNITRRGALVQYIDIVGSVSIRAENVTFRYNRIDSRLIEGKGKYMLSTRDDFPGAVISYCEFIAGFAISAIIPPYGQFTARYLDCWNISNDAIKTGTNCLVEFCWTHHLKKAPGAHADSHQITAGHNTAVRFCRFDMWNGNESDEVPQITDFANAATIVGHMTGDSSWHAFHDNYCDGSNIHMRAGVESPQTVSRGTFYTTYYSYRRNRFGLRFYGLPAYILSGTDPTTVVERETNVWHVSGQTFHRSVSGGVTTWFYSYVVTEGESVFDWESDHFGVWTPPTP
ncbi:fibronectin type III domain-containing protein [Plantactinospora sp. S1510]|uniref:Fibronectin type III domain-containing protein n=1 Tax=Plantactinospora alkalitolerans TaxID=2789879 RepID=A0ABS0HA50_9ACTN|nr:fibronectin type III domain-containing protein [Plantactinospora alkalitolerans]MBF9135300.1 fibronectin type III domain-containing protein [Plantactinospora alkalitolerans]